MEKKDVIWRRLIIALANCNLRQKDLADKTGIQKSTISNYINGKRVPDVVNAYKMSKYLNVAPEYLMGEDDNDFMIVEKNELQQLIAKMSPEMIHKMTTYANFVFYESKEGEI